MKNFRPMLAAKLEDLREVKYPVLASPKLDGIRCIIHQGKALTRALKPVPNKFIRETLESLGSDAEGLDGEIMLKYPATFQDISSAVMSHDKKPPWDWYFHVFDKVPTSLDSPFDVRYRKLEDLVLGEPNPRVSWMHVCLVPHYVITSAEDLRKFESSTLSNGHEGVMIRAISGPYKRGRSTLREGYLLKLKRLVDSEAVIIRLDELYHNNNEAFTGELGQTKRQGLQENLVPGNMMGRMWVMDRFTKVQFGIGTGFTLDQRKHWWKVRHRVAGKIVRYSYQQHGTKDAPRTPVFQGLRSIKDL